MVLGAWYDAMFQTKRIIPFSFIHICFCLLLAAALPFINWWQGVAAFMATQVWFDYIYNAFTGIWWGYLGNTSIADRMLRNFDAYVLFIVRVLVFIGSLIIFNT